MSVTRWLCVLLLLETGFPLKWNMHVQVYIWILLWSEKWCKPMFQMFVILVYDPCNINVNLTSSEQVACCKANFIMGPLWDMLPTLGWRVWYDFRRKPMSLTKIWWHDAFLLWCKESSNCLDVMAFLNNTHTQHIFNIKTWNGVLMPIPYPRPSHLHCVRVLPMSLDIIDALVGNTHLQRSIGHPCR